MDESQQDNYFKFLMLVLQQYGIQIAEGLAVEGDNDIPKLITVSIDMIELFDKDIMLANWISENSAKLMHLSDSIAYMLQQAYGIPSEVARLPIDVQFSSFPLTTTSFRGLDRPLHLRTDGERSQVVTLDGIVTQIGAKIPVLTWRGYRCTRPDCIRVVQYASELSRLKDPEPGCRECFTAMVEETIHHVFKVEQPIQLQALNHSSSVCSSSLQTTVILSGQWVDSVKLGERLVVNGRTTSLTKPVIDLDKVGRGCGTSIIECLSISRFAKPVLHSLSKEATLLASARGKTAWEYNMQIIKHFDPDSQDDSAKLKLALTMSLMIAKSAQYEPFSTVREDIEAHRKLHILITCENIAEADKARMLALRMAEIMNQHTVNIANKSLLFPSISMNGQDGIAINGGDLGGAGSGVCILMEPNRYDKLSMNTLTEVMEKGYLSIRRGDVSEIVPLPCTLIAICTFKKPMNETISIEDGLGLTGGLINRFDLVVNYSSPFGEDADMRATEMILARYLKLDQVAPRSLFSGNRPKRVKKAPTPFEEVITHAVEIDSVLSEETNVLLQAYFVASRQLRNPSSNSAMDSSVISTLIRLATANAKLAFRAETNTADALIAILMMEESMVARNGTGSVFNFKRLRGDAFNLMQYGDRESSCWMEWKKHVMQWVQTRIPHFDLLRSE